MATVNKMACHNFITFGLLFICAVSFLPGAEADNCSAEASPCKKGVILPMWTPAGNLSAGDKAARAIVYICALGFLFLGVSIIADRFMAAIEVITSKEREVTVKKPNGETQVVNVRIWNETVSNLSLMALGSSAPEILLSVIEIIGNRFEAGDLGPSTIVGSAAFNLFVIIGLCVYVIPDGEVRRIKHLRVFFVTATWSIFAYLWMYIIIAVISPGVVHVWEGIVTFLYFPATVGTAYFADRKIFFMKFLSKRYRSSKHKGGIVVGEGSDMELGDRANHVGADDVLYKGMDSDDAEIREFEKHRKDFIDIMRDLRKKHPNMDMKTLEEMAEYEAMNRGPKSRAFYRIQATRKLTGGGNVIKKSKIERKASVTDIKVDIPEDDTITRIFFEPGHYTVMENVGTFHCTVSRMGGNVNNTVYVDYRTEDGTANAGSDYEFAEGTLIFHPGELHKQFPITVIDDDIFEEDEHFYVRLSNIRVGDADGVFTGESQGAKAQLANPSMATIMILDDDHAGIFHFESQEITFPESIGEASVKVMRSSGARGKVKIPYKTIDGTAKGDKDFEHVEGELTFDDDETEGYIKVRIFDDEEYEKNEVFYIEMDEPRLIRRGSVHHHKRHRKDDLINFHDGRGKGKEPENKMTKEEEEKIAELGKPRLGEITKISCHIRESMEFKKTVDKLLQKGNLNLVSINTSSWKEQFVDALQSTVDKLLKTANVSLAVGTSSWREQFIEAVTVSAGDDDDEEGEEGEERLPSCMDYVMHFLSIFWKVLFAFVPPTGYWHGWAAFIVSIVFIGLMTAVIGDLAEGLGCTIGLKATVTAISFVAVGTSLPDYWGGWACFTVSITMIGLLTAVIGDLASSFGCTVGLKDSVTAISFVALGTSLQWEDVCQTDTFASKVAAVGDEYADSSIGNVTGSNAVNVFLGIGVAWTIAAIYHAIKGTTFVVEPGGLAFSVTVFCISAFICIVVIVLRRHKAVGGELGGTKKFRLPTTLFMFSLWLFYVLISSFKDYCYVPGF